MNFVRGHLVVESNLSYEFMLKNKMDEACAPDVFVTYSGYEFGFCTHEFTTTISGDGKVIIDFTMKNPEIKEETEEEFFNNLKKAFEESKGALSSTKLDTSEDQPKGLEGCLQYEILYFTVNMFDDNFNNIDSVCIFDGECRYKGVMRKISEMTGEEFNAKFKSEFVGKFTTFKGYALKNVDKHTFCPGCGNISRYTVWRWSNKKGEVIEGEWFEEDGTGVDVEEIKKFYPGEEDLVARGRECCSVCRAAVVVCTPSDIREHIKEGE